MPSQLPSSRPSLGGGSRPSLPSAGQRPSMPSLGQGGLGQGGLGATARPSLPSAANRPSFQGPQSFNRPSQGQVNNFLNMPSSGGQQLGNRAPSTLPSGGQQLGNRSPSSPAAGARSDTGGDGFNQKTFTTPGGSTITIAGGANSGITQGGATVGGAGAAIKVEGAGGNTVVKGSGAIGASKGDSAAIAGGSRTGVETASGAAGYRGTSTRAATDGTNSAVRSGSATGARDAAGNSIANVRGGYADSSGYRQGGSITGAKNQWGYTAASARGGYGYAGTGTGQFGAVGGIRGPGGNVVTAGRGGAFVNGQFVGGQAWGAVNGAYTRWGCFTPGWYGGYPGAWWPGKWALATTAWATAAWATAGSYCGCSGDGAYYDYGENVTYQDETVYYGDQPVASADQYYDQAKQLAQSKLNSQNDEWLPLGVFALISEPGQTVTDKVVQLAVNKEGAIRGNLQDSLTDSVKQVYGAVDQTAQRAAFMMEGNGAIVGETGLYNLTNDEVPALIHFDATTRESRTMIRLKQPEEGAATF